jgi:hypothetical protein
MDQAAKYFFDEMFDIFKKYVSACSCAAKSPKLISAG